MTEPEKTTLGFEDATGALLMLNKDERLLIRELLFLALKSKKIQAYLEKRLAKKKPHGFSDYFQVGERLLENMGYRLPGKRDSGRNRRTGDPEKTWQREDNGSYSLQDSSVLETED